MPCNPPGRTPHPPPPPHPQALGLLASCNQQGSVTLSAFGLQQVVVLEGLTAPMQLQVWVWVWVYLGWGLQCQSG